jgi:hypothetical protein
LISFINSLDSVPAKPEAIDWELYAKNVSKPGLVASFQKAVSPLARKKTVFKQHSNCYRNN